MESAQGSASAGLLIGDRGGLVSKQCHMWVVITRAAVLKVPLYLRTSPCYQCCMLWSRREVHLSMATTKVSNQAEWEIPRIPAFFGVSPGNGQIGWDLRLPRLSRATVPGVPAGPLHIVLRFQQYWE